MSGAFLAAAFGVACGCMGGEDKSGGKPMSVVFEIQPRSPSWAPGAKVVCDLRIENRGASAVEFPNPMFATSAQPAYRLRRPDGDEVSFKPSSGGDDDALASPTLMRLDPEHVWLGELVVNSHANVSAPGDYVIEARMAWGAIDVVAPPAKFRVAAARFLSISTSIARSDKGSTVREAVLLQAEEKGGVEMAALLRETNPTLGEMAVANVLARGPVPSDARAVYGAYANYETAFDPLRWIVSSSARSIHVAAVPEGGAIDLDAEAAILDVPAPLATKDGLLIITVAESGRGAQILQARLGRDAARGETTALKPVFRLDRVPVATASALTPVARDSRAFAAVVVRGDLGARLLVLELGQNGDAIVRLDHEWPDLDPRSAAALCAGSDGAVRASFAAVDRSAMPALHIVDVRVSGEGKIETDPTISPALLEASKVVDVRIASYETVPGAYTRLAVARGAGGETVVLDDRGRVRPAITAIAADTPFALVPGVSAWYAVAVTPTGVDAVRM